MVNDNCYSLETKIYILGEAEIRRKPYRKPRLEELGTLRDVTLGGSPGVGDSGGTFRVASPPHASALKRKTLILDGSGSGNDLNFKRTKPTVKP